MGLSAFVEQLFLIIHVEGCPPLEIDEGHSFVPAGRLIPRLRPPPPPYAHPLNPLLIQDGT